MRPTGKTAPSTAAPRPGTRRVTKSKSVFTKRGQLDGQETRWYANGQVKAVRSYSKGEIDGRVEEWDHEGKPVFEGEYKHGKQHGQWVYWDHSNDTQIFVEYRNGEQVSVKQTD